MRRVFVLTVGLLLFAVAPTLVCESVAGARPTARAVGIPGTYRVHLKWQGTDWRIVHWTLEPNGQGHDDQGSDYLYWSHEGKAVTVSIVATGIGATFYGTKTRIGFNRRGNPGTATNSTGGSGIWYAVRTG